jgi:predicted trehalose synthase
LIMDPLDNPKHEAFAHAIAMGKKLAEALESGNYKPHPPSGARLLKDAKIRERIAYFKAQIAKERETAAIDLAKKEELTKAWVIDRLMHNAKVALGEEPFVMITEEGAEVKVTAREAPAANKALELLGKELGMFVDRKEIGGPGDFASMDNDELLAEIEREAQALGVAVPDLHKLH